MILRVVTIVLTLCIAASAGQKKSEVAPEMPPPGEHEPQPHPEESERDKLFGFPHRRGGGPMRSMMRNRWMRMTGPVTPEQEKEAFAFLKEIAPWKVEYVQKQKGVDQTAYNTLLRGLIHRKRSLERMLESGDTLKYNRRMTSIKLENRSHVLVQEYRATTDPVQKKVLRVDLVVVLNELFEIREQDKLAQIKHLRSRLKELEDMVAKRRKNKKTIVERRAQSLLGEMDDIRW
jgi:hypothetical protein